MKIHGFIYTFAQVENDLSDICNHPVFATRIADGCYFFVYECINLNFDERETFSGKEEEIAGEIVDALIDTYGCRVEYFVKTDVAECTTSDACGVNTMARIQFESEEKFQEFASRYMKDDVLEFEDIAGCKIPRNESVVPMNVQWSYTLDENENGSIVMRIRDEKYDAYNCDDTTIFDIADFFEQYGTVERNFA